MLMFQLAAGPHHDNVIVTMLVLQLDYNSLKIHEPYIWQ